MTIDDDAVVEDQFRLGSLDEIQHEIGHCHHLYSMPVAMLHIINNHIKYQIKSFSLSSISALFCPEGCGVS
jgi:hypothetical protein